MTIAFLAAMFAVALFAAGEHAKKDASVTAGKPVAFVATESKIYTVICRGTGSRENRALALEIFKGFGIKAVFFTDAGELESSEEAAREIIAAGHVLGLDCSGTSGMNKSEFLRWLAKQNDRFYDATGRRPKYCLAGEEACRYAFDACLTYGQYCVSSATDVKNGAETIKRGDIVYCFLDKKDRLYAFAQAAARAASGGLTPCSMKELLAGYEERVFS